MLRLMSEGNAFVEFALRSSHPAVSWKRAPRTPSKLPPLIDTRRVLHGGAVQAFGIEHFRTVAHKRARSTREKDGHVFLYPQAIRLPTVPDSTQG